VLSVEVSGECEGVEDDDVQRVLAFAFDRLPSSPPGNWNVTVKLGQTDEIARLHELFFGDPTDTDVMSFPSGVVDEACDGNGGYLGDVAISIPISTAQAVEQQHSLNREVCFLALHGLLHLVGMDDASDDERAEMLALQSSLLEAYEIYIGRAL
jgi:probable rRNA maturation factor